MQQRLYHLSVLVIGVVLLWKGMGDVYAEEQATLKKGVLVLPFQAGEGLTEDEVSLGVAVQNVIENMLTLHSDLEEVWCNWHLAKLFPREEDFHNWIRGKGELPTGIQALGFRYLLTGRVHRRDAQLIAVMELLDQTTGNKYTKDVVVDLPALQGFRAGILALLDEARIPVPARQREKMLWAEDLPLPAFVLLGRGVEEYYAVDGYRKEAAQWNSKPFEEGLTVAPRSYLLSNSLGWVFFVQKDYLNARLRFEQALAVNPSGADAADGLMIVGIQTDDERLGETWAKRKAENQGRTQQAALARWWWIRADIAHEQGKPQRAIELLQKAREFDPTRVQYIVRLAQLYQETQHFTEGKELIEAALTRDLPLEQYRTLRLALADLHAVWAEIQKDKKAYAEAMKYYEAVLELIKGQDRFNEALVLSRMSTLYASLEQYERAIEYGQMVVAIVRDLKDRQAEVLTLVRLGGFHVALTQHAQAIPYYEAAAMIYRELQDRSNEALTLTSLGNVYYKLDLYKKAIAFYRQALAIRQEMKDRTSEGTLLTNLGEAHRSLSLYDQAIGFYEQVLTIMREIRNKAKERDTLLLLGLTYRIRGQMETAIPYFEQALAIQREGNDRVGEGNILSILAYTYSAQGRIETEIEYLNHALVIKKEVGDRLGESEILSRLGTACDSLSHYTEAIKYYERALVLARDQNNLQRVGEVLFGLGKAWSARSHYSKAIEYYEQALTIQREAKDRKGEGRTLSGLGTAYQELRHYSKAIEYYRQGQAIMREVKDRAGEGSTVLNLAAIVGALEQYPQMIEYSELALDIAKAVKNRVGEGSALNNLGIGYHGLRLPAKAIEFFEQALAIQRELKDRAGEGSTLHNLGAAYQALRQYAQAAAHYERALVIEREIQDRRGEKRTFHNLMQIYLEQGKPQVAIVCGKQAVNILQAIRSELASLDKELRQRFLTSQEVLYRTLTDLLLFQGRAEEAEQVLKMLKEEEFFEFVSRDRQTAPQLLSTIVYSPSEASFAAQYAKLAEEVTHLAQQRDAMKNASSQPNEHTVQQQTQLAAQLQTASAAFQTFLHDLPEQFDKNTTQGTWTRPSELQQTLAIHEPGTVGLWTLVGEKQSWLVMVMPQRTKVFPLAISAEDLTLKVRQFRAVLNTPRDNPLPLAQELYQLLLAPMRKDLDVVGARTLLWSLDGPLRYIPIGALHDGQQYVVEQYRTGVFTLAGQQVLTTEAAPNWKAAGFGVSKALGGFPALPAVPAELNAVIKHSAHDNGAMPGVIRLDQQFTEATFRTLLDAKYPVVHVASHFHLQPGNETQSFLLLGDGSQLSVDRLKQYHFGGTELVTLSACETGFGGDLADKAFQFSDGKEVESFAMLLQYRGARAVMASLWQVDDPSTKELMAAFYRYRQAHRAVSKLEALQQAQLQLLRGAKPEARQVAKRGGRGASAIPLDDASVSLPQQTTTPYAHPYYWAPFILIGNGQ